MSKEVVGHWHSMIEGFSTSTMEFYELVKAGIAKRQIPDLAISSFEAKESGLGSGKRAYLRISREKLNFDICAAPFGTGYFFSWWCVTIPQVFLDFVVLGAIALFALICGTIAYHSGCSGIFWGPTLFVGGLLGAGAVVRFGEMGLEPQVLSMPVTGTVYENLFRPATYFNEDTAIMFRESLHHAVLEAIESVTSAQGSRGLTDEAKKITFKAKGGT